MNLASDGGIYLKLVFVIVVLIFVVVGILKNKNEHYTKQFGISLMVLATLNTIILFEMPQAHRTVLYLDVIPINAGLIDLFTNLSIGAALLGLLVYLYTEVDS